MRSIVWALLLSSSACITQASGAPAPAEPAPPLQPPAEALPDAAVRFSIQLGVHDEMIARSPELALYARGLYRSDEELEALRALVLEHQPEGTVFGAVAGPTAAEMAEADARLHASDDVLKQAFALDQALGQHTRLYVPAKDSVQLTKGLVAWVDHAYASPIESLPNRPCTIDGAAGCVESLNRFVAVTDVGWGARIDIAELFWPSLDGERVVETNCETEDQRRQDRTVLDALKTTRSKRLDYWARAYAAPGLVAAPDSPVAVVSAAVDPHAVMRLGQALEVRSQYESELGRALRQAVAEPGAEEEAAAYEIPPLASASAGFPFSSYVAHWSFEADTRSIDLEWKLNELGQKLVTHANPKASAPDAASVCADTSACAVFTESFSGILNVPGFDPMSMQGVERGHHLGPIILGAWPNVLSKLAEALPTDPMQADGALAGSAWRDGWGRLEFAVGSWSTDGPKRPAMSSGTRLPVPGGQRYYTEDANFVVLDSPRPQSAGWVAASDLTRAAWLTERPRGGSDISGATVRFSDLLAAQRFVQGGRGASRWSELNIDLELDDKVVRGHLVLSGNRKDVVE